MNIPVNRWTVGVVLVIVALMGGDLTSAVFRAVIAMGNAYVPAV